MQQAPCPGLVEQGVQALRKPGDRRDRITGVRGGKGIAADQFAPLQRQLTEFDLPKKIHVSAWPKLQEQHDQATEQDQGQFALRHS